MSSFCYIFNFFFVILFQIIVFALFVMLANAASLIPLKHSTVNVKSEKSGQEYSYSIQENHGLALDAGAIHEIIPQIKGIKIRDDVKQEISEETKLKEIPLKLEYISPLITYPLHYVPLPYYQLNVNPIPFIP